MPIRPLARFVQTRLPGNSTIVQLPQAVCSNFRRWADELSLNDFLRKPHSVKRGSATSQSQATNSLISWAQSYWAQLRAARLYGNTSLQTLRPTSSLQKQKSKSGKPATFRIVTWPNSIVVSFLLLWLLARFINKQPGDSFIERVPQACKDFRQLVSGLSLNNLLLKPDSMSRRCHKPFPSHRFIG